MPIGLNTRLQKFCSLLAASDGSETTLSLYKKAGFRPDASNASAARKKLIAGGWLQAEREKLGLPPIDAEEAPAIDDEAQAALLEQARATYAMAVAAGDTKSAVKATRIIERALKPRRAPGRPTSTPKSASTQPDLPVGSGRPVADLVSMLLDESDEEEIQRDWPQEKQDAYVAWRNGGDSATYLRIAYEERIAGQPIDGGDDLMTTTSQAALTAGETVRRL